MDIDVFPTVTWFNRNHANDSWKYVCVGRLYATGLKKLASLFYPIRSLKTRNNSDPLASVLPFSRFDWFPV